MIIALALLKIESADLTRLVHGLLLHQLTDMYNSNHVCILLAFYFKQNII